MSKCYLTFDSDFKWTTDSKPWVPVMSGGLLAMGRDWFFKIGGHDQAMKVSNQIRRAHCYPSVVYDYSNNDSSFLLGMGWREP